MSTVKLRTAIRFMGLAALLALLAALPVQAIPGAQVPTIVLAPPSGAPGSEVLVQGSDFTPGGGVTILWDSTLLGRATAGQDGTFRAVITIPVDAGQGDHSITAEDTATKEVALADLAVVVAVQAVDTLILVDYQRMEDIGYSLVNALESKVNTLVGLPKTQSNMVAVIKRLDLESTLAGARNSWMGSEGSVANTNSYVGAIDGFIESLKQSTYPNLQYVILVGAHEVIPMQARPADDMDTPYRESQWAGSLPAGYFKSLYQDATAYPYFGHYLTDSVYGDLSYVNNGYGVDNVLIPELAVGRLVETPSQISTLVDNYVASNGSFSRSDMASIASNDYMDGGQAAANYMGSSADTSLIQSSFSSSLVPPVINAHGDFVYLAGHGNYDYISPGFRAGATTGGDTDDLGNLPDAVIATSGCHNGVSFGNMLYTSAYNEFPEEFAAHQVGVYLGSTGYTWISGTGASTNVALTGWSEKLATHFVKHLLNDGMWTTAGKAYKDAVNEYVSDYGGIGNPHRRVLAIATLYGIPNYHPPRILFAPLRPIGFWVQRWVAWPVTHGLQAAAVATDTVTLQITDWYTDTSGLVHIPGASYTGDCDVMTHECEPVLPIVHTSRVLPPGATVVSVAWKQGVSVSETISNDVPLATMAVLTTSITGTLPSGYADTFYPPAPYYTSTLSTLGGGAVEVGLTVGPVQYRQSTHETRIWTQMVFELKYDIDPAALAADDDGDGLPNYWESGYGLSPNDASGDQGASGDPDQDGLTNAQERDQNTNPLDHDTDHDGSTDGQEVAGGTDPLNPGSRLDYVYLPVTLRNYASP